MQQVARVASCSLIAGLLLSAAAPVMAQYMYNPNAAHEQTPGVRYFGTAKDEQGTRLANVTVVLTTQQTTYVFFTDEVGDYSGMLPVGAEANSVTVGCSKGGFTFKSATKRPGASGGVDSVQVDCVLTAARRS